MAYPSPPSTVKRETKYGIFKTVKTPKPVYYEDVYGTHDSDDEHVEGVVDACETESDSDDEKAFSKSSEYERLFGGYSKKTAGGQGRSPGEGGVVADAETAIDASEDSGKRAEPEYQITPSSNPRRSVRFQKFLVAKKFGMFGRVNTESVDESEATETEKGGASETDPEEESAGEPLPENDEDEEEDAEAEAVKKTVSKPFRAKKRGPSPRARPASRQLLSQQLQELDKAKASARRDARRAGKAQEKAEKEAKRSVRNMARAQKEAKRSIRDMAVAGKKAKATIASKGRKRKAFVLLGIDDVDRDEYQRFD